MLYHTSLRFIILFIILTNKFITLIHTKSILNQKRSNITGYFIDSYDNNKLIYCDNTDDECQKVIPNRGYYINTNDEIIKCNESCKMINNSLISKQDDKINELDDTGLIFSSMFEIIISINKYFYHKYCSDPEYEFVKIKTQPNIYNFLFCDHINRKGYETYDYTNNYYIYINNINPSSFPYTTKGKGSLLLKFDKYSIVSVITKNEALCVYSNSYTQLSYTSKANFFISLKKCYHCSTVDTTCDYFYDPVNILIKILIVLLIIFIIILFFSKNKIKKSILRKKSKILDDYNKSSVTENSNHDSYDACEKVSLTLFIVIFLGIIFLFSSGIKYLSIYGMPSKNSTLISNFEKYKKNSYNGNHVNMEDSSRTFIANDLNSTVNILVPSNTTNHFIDIQNKNELNYTTTMDKDEMLTDIENNSNALYYNDGKYMKELRNTKYENNDQDKMLMNIKNNINNITLIYNDNIDNEISKKPEYEYNTLNSKIKEKKDLKISNDNSKGTDDDDDEIDEENELKAFINSFLITDDSKIIVGYFLVVIITFILSYIYYIIALRYIKFIIYFSFVSIYIISIFVIVILSKESKHYLLVIIGLCFVDTLLFVSSFLISRKRISFTEEILKNSLLSIKNHPLIIFLNSITTLTGIIINTIIVISAYGYITKYENKEVIIVNSIDIYEILIMSFLLFSYYYFNEIVKNIIHVTIAGTTTFFLKGDNSSHPISSSFKNCIFFRFGSICFGSLLNTFVRRMENTLNIISYVTIPIIFILPYDVILLKHSFSAYALVGISFIYIPAIIFSDFTLEEFLENWKMAVDKIFSIFNIDKDNKVENFLNWLYEEYWVLYIILLVGLLPIALWSLVLLALLYIPSIAFNIFLQFFNFIVVLFNDYTFSIIGIYWKTFLKSSKLTYNIMENNRFDLFINNGIIRCVLIVSQYIIIFASMLPSYLIVKVMDFSNETKIIYMTGLFFICRKIFSSFTSGIYTTNITVFSYFIGYKNNLDNKIEKTSGMMDLTIEKFNECENDILDSFNKLYMRIKNNFYSTFKL